MGLRDPLLSFNEKEPPAEFMARALYAAREASGHASPRLRLEVGTTFSFGDSGARSHCGASLWVERGRGRTESWQRVTGLLLAETYEDVLRMIGQALDAAALINDGEEAE